MRQAIGKVELNAVAPDFTLPDFEGRDVTLSTWRGKQRVLLVFARGFG
jgi:peroxiredoxin